MELLAFIAFLGICVFAYHQHKKGRQLDEQRTTELQASLNATAYRGSNDSKPKWSTIEYKWGKETRPEGWVALRGGSDVKVAGFNQRSGLSFIRSIQPQYTEIDLVREPDNRVDENAIAVFGINGSKRQKLGYLPADLAGDIAAEFSPELPIEPELRRVGWIEGEDACFMAINVIVPSAKERKKFLL